MMGRDAKAGVALFLMGALVGGLPAMAQSQGKELSDKSVLTLMQYAWGMVPNKFTTPLGKVIEVDKSKPSQAIVPMDMAREVIRVARLSAYAQLCDLLEEQRANYQTFMLREQDKKKWSDQQMLFLNQLHLFTVMTLTGKVALVEKDGDKQVIVQEGKPAKTESCTDTERNKVKEQIMAFINSQPPTDAASAQPTKKAEQPTPTSQKK